jgi:hypothetical protein
MRTVKFLQFPLQEDVKILQEVVVGRNRPMKLLWNAEYISGFITSEKKGTFILGKGKITLLEFDLDGRDYYSFDPVSLFDKDIWIMTDFADILKVEFIFLTAKNRYKNGFFKNPMKAIGAGLKFSDLA